MVSIAKNAPGPRLAASRFQVVRHDWQPLFSKLQARRLGTAWDRDGQIDRRCANAVYHVPVTLLDVPPLQLVCIPADGEFVTRAEAVERLVAANFASLLAVANGERPVAGFEWHAAIEVGVSRRVDLSYFVMHWPVGWAIRERNGRREFSAEFLKPTREERAAYSVPEPVLRAVLDAFAEAMRRGCANVI